MQTLVINGTEYIGARALEKHFKLTRKKCWELLKKSELEHVQFSTSWLYPANEAIAFITSNLKSKKSM